MPKDIKKAVEWLDRAAAQKNPYAAYLAGKIYLTEDEVKASDKLVQDLTDKFIKEVDTISAEKDKEIMAI